MIEESMKLAKQNPFQSYKAPCWGHNGHGPQGTNGCGDTTVPFSLKLSLRSFRPQLGALGLVSEWSFLTVVDSAMQQSLTIGMLEKMSSSSSHKGFDST